MRTASIQREIARQLLLALVALSLALLSLGHTSAVFADGGRVVFTGHAICGDDGSTPAPGEHFACHACRQDVPVVPPAPIAVEPAVFGCRPVAYAGVEFVAPAETPVVAAQPRGPPVLI